MKLSDDTLLKTLAVYSECDCIGTEAAKKLGLSRKTVESHIRKAKARGLFVAEGPAKKAAGPGRRGALGYEDFCNRYDDSKIIPSKIESGVELHLMKNGEPAAMKEHEFREACGVPVGKWRRYAEAYAHLQIKVPGGLVYWAHPAIIDRLREVINR